MTVLDEQIIEHSEKNEPMATPEYIFPNQKEDALNIMNRFYTSVIRFMSILHLFSFQTPIIYKID